MHVWMHSVQTVDHKLGWSLGSMTSVISLVPCSTAWGFLVSYSHPHLVTSLVHRKATAVSISCHVLLYKHNSLATKWWNNCALSSHSFSDFVLILNKCAVAGIFNIPLMPSGNSCRCIFSLHLLLYNPTTFLNIPILFPMPWWVEFLFQIYYSASW